MMRRLNFALIAVTAGLLLSCGPSGAQAPTPAAPPPAAPGAPPSGLPGATNVPAAPVLAPPDSGRAPPFRTLLPAELHLPSLTSALTGTTPAYLAHDVLVGEAHDHAVLGRVVLVLVLSHQAQARTVVGFTLAPALVLHLCEAKEQQKSKGQSAVSSRNCCTSAHAK